MTGVPMQAIASLTTKPKTQMRIFRTEVLYRCMAALYRQIFDTLEILSYTLGHTAGCGVHELVTRSSLPLRRLELTGDMMVHPSDFTDGPSMDWLDTCPRLTFLSIKFKCSGIFLDRTFANRLQHLLILKLHFYYMQSSPMLKHIKTVTSALERHDFAPNLQHFDFCAKSVNTAVRKESLGTAEKDLRLACEGRALETRTVVIENWRVRRD